VTDAADGPTALVEAIDRRDLPRFEAAWRDLAARAAHYGDGRPGGEDFSRAAVRRQFGVAAPRLAVAGLNPHAGEGGAMGREDIDIVAPAVAELRHSGIEATGPLPADTLFHAEARGAYDAALCMYHDQALIPVKTIDFFGGVNATLGLPFIRTSPDHGTAFALAGTGKARPESLIAAIIMAGEMAKRRYG